MSVFVCDSSNLGHLLKPDVRAEIWKPIHLVVQHVFTLCLEKYLMLDLYSSETLLQYFRRTMGERQKPSIHTKP